LVDAAGTRPWLENRLLEPALIVANNLDGEDVRSVTRSLDVLVESALSSAAEAS
jgi:hypothetical protein